MSRLTISLEHHLARQLDALVRDGGYTNRSAAVREMIRFGLDRADLLSLGMREPLPDCVASVSFLCAEDDPSAWLRLMGELHACGPMLVNSSRHRLEDGTLMGSVVLRGPGRDVKAWIDRIVGLRGISKGASCTIPLGAPDPVLRVSPAWGEPSPAG